MTSPNASHQAANLGQLHLASSTYVATDLNQPPRPKPLQISLSLSGCGVFFFFFFWQLVDIGCGVFLGCFFNCCSEQWSVVDFVR